MHCGLVPPPWRMREWIVGSFTPLTAPCAALIPGALLSPGGHEHVGCPDRSPENCVGQSGTRNLHLITRYYSVYCSEATFASTGTRQLPKLLTTTHGTRLVLPKAFQLHHGPTQSYNVLQTCWAREGGTHYLPCVHMWHTHSIRVSCVDFRLSTVSWAPAPCTSQQ